MRLKPYQFSPAFFIALLASCNLGDIPDTENLYLPDYKGDIALLLGKDTITVKDFLTELTEDTSTVQEGDNLDLFIVYTDSTSFNLGSEFVQVESFSNSKFIPSPIKTGYVPPKDTVLSIRRSINFNFKASEDEQIDSLYYSSGSFEIELNSGFPGDVEYSLETSSFRNISSNAPISIQSSADYTGTVPVLDNHSVELEGYKTLLSSNADSNIFVLNVDADIHISAGTPLSGMEYLNIALNIQDPEFNALFGDFGQDTFDIESQEIALDIFSDFSESGISFETPSFTFDFENSFGIPVGLDFSGVYAEFDEKSDMPLTGSIANALQQVLAPDLQAYGSFASSSIVIDGNNSNIGDIISATPNRIVLPLTGISNPDDEGGNFLLDDSGIILNSTIKLPLSVKLEAFQYESEFELGTIDELEQSEEIVLVFNTVNELPFDGELDLFFLDESNEEFDSLTNISIFKSPTSFDDIGKAANPEESTTEVVLDKQRIESLTASTTLKLVVKLNSYGYQDDRFVQIFSDYSMITSISIRGKVSVNLNSN